MCVCVCVCVVHHVHMWVQLPKEARRGQEVIESSELELLPGVSCLIWVLDPELRFSRRAASVHKHWAISSALEITFLLIIDPKVWEQCFLRLVISISTSYYLSYIIFYVSQDPVFLNVIWHPKIVTFIECSVFVNCKREKNTIERLCDIHFLDHTISCPDYKIKMLAIFDHVITSYKNANWTRHAIASLSSQHSRAESKRTRIQALFMLNNELKNQHGTHKAPFQNEIFILSLPLLKMNEKYVCLKSTYY